nr:type VI secretion system tip protein VgrG [Gammaproteobacteria bacterium]
RADGAPRIFNGYVRRFTGGASHMREFRRYSAEVVPWLWFLTRTSDCRIFQNKSVPDILECVFDELEIGDYRFDLHGEHPAREYCVQYRESTFDFVSRLMEQEGMFYWFEHEEGKHTMVIADHRGAYVKCPQSAIEYVEGSRNEDHLFAWRHDYQFRSGRFAQADFNFESPSTDLLSSTNTLLDLKMADRFELFDYPGAFVTKGRGETLTKLRMEQQEATYDVVQAASNCRTLHAGGTFRLERHDVLSEEDQCFVMTGVRHTASDTTHVTGSEPAYYENEFTCIPSSMVFRPQLTTTKPVVQGPQTAMVVGPKGEDIYPDEYGRVKVQFHWDRRGQYDENSSCWVRVAQVWAGKKWGAMYIPRVGQEVIVDFLEGDPDQPIVTGRVYNAESMPPYDLPASKTVSTMKSASSDDGQGYNELRFEDKNGEEQIFMHAQRNQDVRVKNDAFVTVENDRHVLVENTLREQVKTDHHQTVDGNRLSRVGGDISLDAAADVRESTGGDQHLRVLGGHFESAGGARHLSAGQTIVLDAGMQISIKAGSSFITLGPAGVDISGPMVKINSGGSATAATAPASPDAPEAPEAACDGALR